MKNKQIILQKNDLNFANQTRCSFDADQNILNFPLLTTLFYINLNAQRKEKERKKEPEER